jgi:hypothetical protein
MLAIHAVNDAPVSISTLGRARMLVEASRHGSSAFADDDE